MNLLRAVILSCLIVLGGLYLKSSRPSPRPSPGPPVMVTLTIGTDLAEPGQFTVQDWGETEVKTVKLVYSPNAPMTQPLTVPRSLAEKGFVVLAFRKGLFGKTEYVYQLPYPGKNNAYEFLVSEQEIMGQKFPCLKYKGSCMQQYP